MSFLDVAPPLGPTPGAELSAPYVGGSARTSVLALPWHTLHTLVAGPAGWGRLGEGSTGGDLCPVSLPYPLYRSGGNRWGVPVFPRYPSGTLGFSFLLSGKPSFLDSHFFLQTEIAILAVFTLWVPALG